MNEIKVFSNAEFGKIRTLNRDGEPWFVGKDVATALGYKDSVNALKSHVSEEDKGGWRITTQYGEREAVIINESGLYSLILSSKLDSAKRFKRWVTAEVLPSIRKSGGYSRGNAAILVGNLPGRKKLSLLVRGDDPEDNAACILYNAAYFRSDEDAERFLEALRIVIGDEIE